MIYSVLKVIKEEVGTYLKLKISDSREQYIHLVPVIGRDGNSSVSENTVCMSLVKIEEDKMVESNAPQVEYTANSTRVSNPPVKFNLYVLFSASAKDGQEANYREALKRISLVISFFQAKNVFTSANTPRLDHRIGKFTAELFNMNMEEQNNLWGMLGGSYRPSVLFLFRSLVISEDHAQIGGGPVLEKDIELRNK